METLSWYYGLYLQFRGADPSDAPGDAAAVGGSVDLDAMISCMGDFRARTSLNRVTLTEFAKEIVDRLLLLRCCALKRMMELAEARSNAPLTPYEWLLFQLLVLEGQGPVTDEKELTQWIKEARQKDQYWDLTTASEARGDSNVRTRGEVQSCLAHLLRKRPKLSPAGDGGVMRTFNRLVVVIDEASKLVDYSLGQFSLAPSSVSGDAGRRHLRAVVFLFVFSTAAADFSSSAVRPRPSSDRDRGHQLLPRGNRALPSAAHGTGAPGQRCQQGAPGDDHRGGAADSAL